PRGVRRLVRSDRPAWHAANGNDLGAGDRARGGRVCRRRGGGVLLGGWARPPGGRRKPRRAHDRRPRAPRGPAGSQPRPPPAAAPGAGEQFRNPGLARTLRAIATGGPDAFYRGEIGAAIVSVIEASGGVMAASDLAAHTSTWDEPISTTYRGMRVWECPPNGQGITALVALNILEGFDLGGQDPLGAERFHLLVEAMRLAFADTRWYVADPRATRVPIAELLAKPYAARRRALIDPRRAAADVRRGAPV